jgi:hypothetical protein
MQEVGMEVELGDDAMHPIAIVESISFHMPLGDILELISVLYVPRLTKNFLSNSMMTSLRYMTKFDNQQILQNNLSINFLNQPKKLISKLQITIVNSVRDMEDGDIFKYQ